MRIRMRRHGPSAGGRAVARAMGVRMLRLNNSRYRPRPRDVVINWGSSEPYSGCRVLNVPEAVARAVDKKITWRTLELNAVPTVTWTEDHAEALRWMRENNERVLARRLLRGSQGRGITVYSRDGTEHSQPMYEMGDEGGVYVKAFGNVLSNEEFRVHVVGGEAIDAVQKKRRRGHESINPYIRSYNNGWVFCREGINVPPAVLDAAVRAVRALGLDFGAVDIAHDPSSGHVCVYEVNSAPGVEGTTLESYANALYAAVHRG